MLESSRQTYGDVRNTEVEFCEVLWVYLSWDSWQVWICEVSCSLDLSYSSAKKVPGLLLHHTKRSIKKTDYFSISHSQASYHNDAILSSSKRHSRVRSLPYQHDCAANNQGRPHYRQPAKTSTTKTIGTEDEFLQRNLPPQYQTCLDFDRRFTASPGSTASRVEHVDAQVWEGPREVKLKMCALPLSCVSYCCLM